MKKQEAQNIINKYGEVIANDGNVFRKESSLPCSKARIRYAFFVFIESFFSEIQYLPKDVGENLVTTYSMLDCFVSDEKATALNETFQSIKNKKSNLTDDYSKIDECLSLARNAICNLEYSNEINAFIEECYKAADK